MTPIFNKSTPATLSFLICWGLGLLLLSGTVLFWGYKESFIQIHSQRNLIFDLCMPWITFLGNGGVAGTIGWILLRKKGNNNIITFVIILIVTGFAVQGLKRGPFLDWNRPPFELQDTIPIYTLPQKKLMRHSFPSGHATTAAAWAITMILVGKYRKRWVGIAIACVGLAIGYSRIYLGVHFPGDVLAGFIFGGGIAWLFIHFLHPKWERWFPKLNTSKILKWTFTILAIVSLGYELYQDYPTAY